VRTAIISDLHLGTVSGEDLLRDPAVRDLLLAELRGADRVVLLGDVVELRDLPVEEALAAARPFFEALGASGAGEILLVPGNHDHRLAEPLLDRAALAERGSLGLEQHFAPAAPVARRLASWLKPAPLRLAYPGVWLRDDVYATHGHYMDCHLTLPRAEAIAVAAVMRAVGEPPDPAVPADYERVLAPVYGLTYGLAQSGAPRLAGGASKPAERAWRWLHADSGRPRRSLLAAAATKTGLPLAVAAVNRLLGAHFDPDLSPEAISRGGIAAALEMVGRLRIPAMHVVTGHTHRAGPRSGDWLASGGVSVHNTGSWVYARALHRPGSPGGPYWPGTLTWLEDSEAPRRVSLLEGLAHADLAALVRQQASHAPARRLGSAAERR
jgi:hypothetical protein